MTDHREEARRLFLEHVWMLADFWASESRATTARERVEGLAFSLLVTLDGESGDLPRYGLVPVREGKGAPAGDIGGALHEAFVSVPQAHRYPLSGGQR